MKDESNISNRVDLTSVPGEILKCVECNKEITKDDIGVFFDTGKGPIYMCKDCLNKKARKVNK